MSKLCLQNQQTMNRDQSEKGIKLIACSSIEWCEVVVFLMFSMDYKKGFVHMFYSIISHGL